MTTPDPKVTWKQVSRLAKEYGIRVISPQTPHKSSSEKTESQAQEAQNQVVYSSKKSKP